MNDIPAELLNAPLDKWQLNLTTLALIGMILGRAYKAIRQGGGLRGIYRGLVYGENVPNEVKKITDEKPTP
jgi:hypothetical protein